MPLRRSRLGSANVSNLTIDLPSIPLPGGGSIDFDPFDPFGGGGGGGGGPTPCPRGTSFSIIAGRCLSHRTTIPAGIGGGGGDPILNPPGFAPDTGTGDGCLPFFSPDPITGDCRLDLDPGPGQGLPGGNGAAGGGLTKPRATSRTVLECPTFADGRKGILWMSALTGNVVCLPRRTSGKGFGLIRKNPPRAKPFISAAEKKLLNKISSVQKRAKSFASDAGFSCKKK